jgi:hypothetical protein
MGVRVDCLYYCIEVVIRLYMRRVPVNLAAEGFLSGVRLHCQLEFFGSWFLGRWLQLSVFVSLIGSEIRLFARFHVIWCGNSGEYFFFKGRFRKSFFKNGRFTCISWFWSASSWTTNLLSLPQSVFWTIILWLVVMHLRSINLTVYVWRTNKLSFCHNLK